VKITYPESMPGFSEIVVLARDGATHSSYRIYFSVDESYTNSRLDSIRVANNLLENFDPDVLEYDVLLPAGTSKYYGISGYAQVNAASVKTDKPAALPGTATIKVTAVDMHSSTTYLLHISMATSVKKQDAPGSRMISVIPVQDIVELRMNLAAPTDLHIRIVDMSGKIWKESSHLSLPPGHSLLGLDAPADPGFYLISIKGIDLLWSEKICIQ
jgi:hypothetical protein